MYVNDLEGNDTSGEAIKVILQSKCGSYKRESRSYTYAKY